MRMRTCYRPGGGYEATVGVGRRAPLLAALGRARPPERALIAVVLGALRYEPACAALVAVASDVLAVGLYRAGKLIEFVYDPEDVAALVGALTRRLAGRSGT
jgi:hypothetical protein